MFAPSFAPPLLAVKFHQPAAPRHQVARPALLARLNDGLAAGRPLTLIAAPAGYGKTTLAAQWTAQLERPVAWLALDEADDDPLRFCTYFVAAMQRVQPAIGVELLPMLRAGQLPPQAVVAATLLNDLEAAHTSTLAQLGLICVLDDFHTVQDPAILGILQELLAHSFTGLHLALVTRENPALPLGRLRARDQLTEVRAADLRFDGAETAAFLRDGMGLALSEADLARLAARTEGWPAGLQLAGLSLQGRVDPAAFVETLSGSHRFILGYLTEEVLARQPADVQAFLQDTSILARLSGDLCDAVAGRTDSTAVLERLLAANLFLIPLDDEGRWYRYHHLFADLLQGQLRRRGADHAAVLHQRASRWHAEQSMPAESIGHALSAGDTSRAVDLLEINGWALLNQGYAATMEGWLERLPGEWRGHSPRISLDFAWMHLLRGSLDQAWLRLAQAETGVAKLDSSTAPARALEAECLALRANLLQAQGQAADAVEIASRALAGVAPDDQRVIALANLALGGACRQLPDFDRGVAALLASIRASRVSGDLVTDMLAVAHLTLMAVQYGRLRLAAEVATEALDRLADNDAAPPPIVGAVHGALGLIYYEWNQVGQAREHLQRGIRLGTVSGHTASLIYSLGNLARLLQGARDSTAGSGPDLAAAGRALDEAAALLAHGAPGWVRPELISRQVNLALAQGNLHAAETRLRQSGVAVDSAVTHQTDPIHLAWLRLLRAQRRDQEGLALARRILAAAEAGGRHGVAWQALILGALIQADDRRASTEWLARALALAEPEGAIRVFLDEGPAMAALLRRVRYPPWLPAFPGQARAEMSGAESTARSGGDALIEPLSQRELEVLQLLAEGLTYAEVARRLVVSVNTVRFHVKEIYGKLGVNRQAQAVARAQELGLL
jgi:LuxR family maltose regulon positive regulatory protein